MYLQDTVTILSHTLKHQYSTVRITIAAGFVLGVARY